jgi:hypothetical protein
MQATTMSFVARLNALVIFHKEKTVELKFHFDFVRKATTF